VGWRRRRLYDPRMPSSDAAPAVPHPAATVVLLRPGLDAPDKPEVLLIHRPSTMAFGPGLHVFPGGKVDLADGGVGGWDGAIAAAALGGNVPPGDALAIHRAALRELEEEAGVRLARFEDLVPIAHWTTPRFMPRRFSTWFFVADLPPGVEPAFAAAEVAAHRWVTAPAALEQMAAREIDMWVPTTSVLERLIATGAQMAAEVAQTIRLALAPEPRIVEERPNLVRFAFGAVGGLPGRVGETILLGGSRLLVVDPGDPSDEALDLLLATVERRGGALSAIVLTRTDPDHAAAAEAIAIPYELPVLVAPGGGRHLPYATTAVADGDRLPSDLDVRVRLGPEGSGRLEIEAGSAGE